MNKVRRFCCHFWFVDWHCLSLGFHVSLKEPNIEIHLPFGFIRIGLELHYPDSVCINEGQTDWRGFGWCDGRWSFGRWV